MTEGKVVLWNTLWVAGANPLIIIVLLHCILKFGDVQAISRVEMIIRGGAPCGFEEKTVTYDDVCTGDLLNYVFTIPGICLAIIATVCCSNHKSYRYLRDLF